MYCLHAYAVFYVIINVIGCGHVYLKGHMEHKNQFLSQVPLFLERPFAKPTIRQTWKQIIEIKWYGTIYSDNQYIPLFLTAKVDSNYCRKWPERYRYENKRIVCMFPKWDIIALHGQFMSSNTNFTRWLKEKYLLHH